MGIFWGGKTAHRRRQSDWRLVDDLGLTTTTRRAVAYALASGVFLLSFCLAVVAVGDRQWFTAAATGFVACIAAWAVVELGTAVGLGPKADGPAQAPRWQRGRHVDRDGR